VSNPTAHGDELVAVGTLWRATGRQFTTSFLGTSMLPTIAPGVEVTIDCGRAWAASDIVAYVVAGRLIVHRIEAASDDKRWLLTRGDASVIPDDPFEAADAVIGVVTSIHRGEGWIDPTAAPRTWLRDQISRASLAAFKRNVQECRRRLVAFRIVGTVITFGPRAIRKLIRLLRRA
jgi:hypothetical protein